MRDHPVTEVVIVGAGPAGLATAACLRRREIPFALLEQGSQIATPWRTHYDRLHLHTTKASSALPYRRFSREVPRYPSRQQVLAYLEEYADHFGLAPVFGETVRLLRREGEHWVTETRSSRWRSRSVVIATVYTRVPHRPAWPGLSSFEGPVVHSSEYRNGSAWTGRRVLVVGLGNSGGEIALDLSEHGACPAVATRGPLNAVPRDFLGISMASWARVLQLLPLRIADSIGKAVSRIALGRLSDLGLRPLPYGAMTEIRPHARIPLIDVGTVEAVRRGRIQILPAVESFSERAVRFSGNFERDFDAVVLATGYRPELAPFLAAHPGALDQDGMPLDSGKETAPDLYFCGFHVTPTGVFREIAREAKRIAKRIARKSASRACSRGI